MKHLIIIFATLCIISCSKNDDDKTIEIERFQITVGTVCSSSGGTINSYCVSKSTYETIKNRPLVPCPFFTFTTIDNVSKSGYLRSYSTSYGTSFECN